MYRHAHHPTPTCLIHPPEKIGGGQYEAPVRSGEQMVKFTRKNENSRRSKSPRTKTGDATLGFVGEFCLIYRSEYRAGSRRGLALCSTLPCGKEGNVF